MSHLRPTVAVLTALALTPFIGGAAAATTQTASVSTPPAAASAVSPAAVSAAAVAPTAVAPTDLAAARAVILSETNAARAAAGLPALTASVELDAVAQSCSETQAASATMGHCTGFADRYPAGWTSAAENVAYGQAVEDVVDAWLASPGHRANILEPSATHIGIGVATSADGAPYYTQNFASYPSGSGPAPAPAPAPEPAPEPEPAPAPEPAPCLLYTSPSPRDS